MKKKKSDFRSIDFKIFSFIVKDTDKYLISKKASHLRSSFITICILFNFQANDKPDLQFHIPRLSVLPKL